MTFSYFITYFLIIFFATITPGPSMLLALSHGANYGARKAVYSGLGNLIGNLLMALVSILGLGIVLIASGVVFNIIKWLGVAYLVFIGIKMLLAPVSSEEDNNSSIKYARKRGSIRLFFDGFLMAVSNPKGIIFFTALFPQFIDIQKASVSSFSIIFGTLATIAFGCYMLYAVFGVKLNSLFKKPSFKKIFNRITGSLFIGLGVTIAFAKR